MSVYTPWSGIDSVLDSDIVVDDAKMWWRVFQVKVIEY